MKRLNKFLKHLFIPHKGNAYRPHALRHKALSLYSISLILSQLVFGVTLYSGPIILGTDAKVMATNIITYSNFERREAGLSTLFENETLSKAAQDKLKDMFEKNYWDHTGPKGETAWMFIEQEGYRYLLAGENLARGFAVSEEAVKAWMNSPTHRANILNPRFREIGVAVGSGKINGSSTTVIVQLFGEPKTAFASEKSGQVLGSEKVIPEFSFNNAALPSRAPYFAVWAVLFGLIVLDGVMVRRLGLHASKSHIFNFRASLLLACLGLLILSVGFVAIA